MSLPMKIMCINDSQKPKEIPQHKWVEKGTVYTLVGVQQLLSSNSLGFELAEIKLDESCFPYFYFNPNRFIPIDNELDNLMDEVEELIHSPIV